MEFAQIKDLIFQDLQAAFEELDRWDWASNSSSYFQLKREFIQKPQGFSIPDLQDRLIQLITLHHYPVQNGKEPRLLTPPPFIPELFLGREADLASVYQQLFHEHQLLLLVNGQGGIGKTTLAAKYWERYKTHYSHVAWVFAGDDLTAALLALAPELGLSFPETLPNAERLPILIQKFSSLDKPCLLIIDNANDLPELEKHYLALRSCANFHILLTSRITEFEQAARHAIQPLEQDIAIELFQRHYPRYQPSEEALLRQILSAVGYNTLVIELLAKNLRNLNKLREQYSLQQLLQDLQSKGLLSITKSSSVNTGYQAQGTLRQASPEAIIAAMYELGDLPQVETQLLCVFAVLPAERIELSMLEKLLPGILLDEPLSRLAQLGWLEFEEQDLSFKISPVVQQIIRQQNQATLKTDCQLLIDSLQEQLLWEGSGHYADYSLAGKLTAYASAVIGCFKRFDNDIALLCERVGKYHQVTGNLSAALFYFEQYLGIKAKLFEENPQDEYFKNSLALAYERLGSTHSELGNLPLALTFFEKETKLFEKLYATYPENVEFKNGLAGSYSRLGSTHSELGNLPLALTFFEKDLELSKELYAAYPENVSYKNGMAISYSKLGSTHRDLGNLPQALAFFEKDLELSKELYEAYPENVEFKNGLAGSYSQLGFTHSDLGNLLQALTFFEKRSQLSKELYAAYPENVSFKSGLAGSYSRLGSMHSELGNLPLALTFFEKRSQLSKELYTAYPENVEFKNGLAGSYSQLGSTHSDLGNLPLALIFFEKDLELSKELFEAYPENVSFKSGLASSYAKLGMIHLLLEEGKATREAFKAFSQLSQELHTQAPDNISFYSNYAEAFAVSAALKQLQGENALADLAAAQQHFEHMQQRTGRDYFAQKSALVAQMQNPGADLRALIIELSKS